MSKIAGPTRVILQAIIALMLLGVSACGDLSPKPRETAHADNFTVSLLFEHEGCRVYHFVHGMRDRYYSKCELSSSVMSSVNERNGKATNEVGRETPTGYTFHNKGLK